MRIFPTIVRPAAVVLASFLLLAAGCKGDRRADDDATGPDGAGAKGQLPYYYGLITEYRSVLAQDPHNLAALVALGNALYDAGQWKEAIAAYKQALELYPHNADVITDLGTCYRNMGYSDEAISHYERALAIEPTHQNALFNLGIAYGYDRKDYAKAIATWDRLLHIAPKHPRVEEIQASLARFRQALRKGGG